MSGDTGSGAVSEGVWREPAEETLDLYPNLVVHDGRQTGSITFGRSRIPLWCVIGEYAANGWEGVEHGWELSELGWTGRDFSDFIYNLFEMRGEFARLLLTLANAERLDGERNDAWMTANDDGSGLVVIPLEEYPTSDSPPPWWEHRESRTAVLDQLRRCVAALETTDTAPPTPSPAGLVEGDQQ